MSSTSASEDYIVLDKETYFICPLQRPHRIPSKSQGLLRHIAKCTQTLRVENNTHNGASQHPDCFGVLHWVKQDHEKIEQHAKRCLTLLRSQKRADPPRLVIDQDEPPNLLERLDKKSGTLCRACLQDVDYEQTECPNCFLINPQILFEHTIDDLKDFAIAKYISKQHGRSEANNNNNNNNDNDNNCNKRKSSTRDTQVNHPQKSARGESRSFDGRNRTDRPSNRHNSPQSNKWDDDTPRSSGSSLTRNEQQNPHSSSQTQGGNKVANANTNDPVTLSRKEQVSSNSNESKGNTTTTTTATTTRQSDGRDSSAVSEKQQITIDSSPPLSPILSPPLSPFHDAIEEPPLANTTNCLQTIPPLEIQPTASQQPNTLLQETTVDKEVPPYSGPNIRALSNRIDPSRDPRLRK